MSLVAAANQRFLPCPNEYYLLHYLNFQPFLRGVEEMVAQLVSFFNMGL
jgi:hypothetical protein